MPKKVDMAKNTSRLQLRPNKLTVGTVVDYMNNNENIYVQMYVYSDEMLHYHHIKFKFSQSSAVLITFTIKCTLSIRDVLSEIKVTDWTYFQMKG